MRQFLVFSIFAAVIFCGECRRLLGEEDESCLKIDVDDYLDRVFQKARQELDDPMRLPARSSIVELNDGLLWGMSNITRLGEAEVTCKDNTITIKGKITTDEIKGRYTWSKRRVGKDWTGYVLFMSHDFVAETEVAIERREGEVSHPRLVKFEIKKFQDTTIQMTGLGYLTWALGEVTSLMSGIFQRVIAHNVEGPLREAIEREMRDIDIE